MRFLLRPAVAPDAMVRSVTPPTGSTDDGEMGVIGYLVAAGLVLVLLPLVPFLAVLWLVDRLGGG